MVRVGDTYLTDFFQAGTLTFDAQKDGVALTQKSLEISADPGSGTTVLQLMEFVRDALGIDTESSITDTPLPIAGSVSLVDGQIVVTSNLGEENAVEIPLSAFRLEPADGWSPQRCP